MEKRTRDQLTLTGIGLPRPHPGVRNGRELKGEHLGLNPCRPPGIALNERRWARMGILVSLLLAVCTLGGFAHG